MAVAVLNLRPQCESLREAKNVWGVSLVTAQARARLGIIVGGGPAPGINSAIGAVTIEALNSGLEVVGIYDGFEHVVNGRTDMAQALSISDVSRIHFQGGSILRTSRTSITGKPGDLVQTVHTLKEMGISYLVLIGGDGTSNAAMELARAAKGSIRVAQIPKTIDNDLPLPGGMPTFGFETARHVGTEMVINMMEDSRSTNRWYFVVVMGRSSGHLALAIGKAAGATLTVIPEEFSEDRVSVDRVCRVLQGAILKRQMMGRRDGLAVIAEGVAEKFQVEELRRFPGVEISEGTHGQMRLNEIPLASILKRETSRGFAAWGRNTSAVDVTLGYALRSAPPIPFDIDYTRTLGYGAVRFLLSEPVEDRLQNGGLICLQDGHLRVLAFDDLIDPATAKTKVRLVDTRSEHYAVACEYMIRLEPDDLDDSVSRQKMASAINMTGQEFAGCFGPTVAPRALAVAS